MDQNNLTHRPQPKAESEGDNVDFTINEADIDKPEPSQESATMKHRKRFKKLHLPKTKKGRLGLIIVLVIIAGLVYHFTSSTKPKVTIADLRKTTVPKSDLVPSLLTGQPVAPSVNKIPITGVMIENSRQARPQSGLSSAGVVFEALTEGGITRFLALYQNTAPNNVGPIRSARPYFVSWDMGFGAAYAHVGGSPAALSDIQAWGTEDLNQFYNGNYYHRISSRLAPHNVYTAISTLNQLEQNKGFTSVTFQGFPRQKAQPLAKPSVTNINLALSRSDYNVNYTYDSKTNTYNRDEGGAPMIDANNNQQISPSVVIAIVVQETQGPLDSSGAYYSEYNVNSSGTAYVFQDGGLTIGQWSKAGNNSPIVFTTNNGNPLRLIPGQAWITAITSQSQLTYGL